MFKNNIKLLTLAIAIFFSGCGYKETTYQTRDVAYLKFEKGAFKNYTVTVNDKYTFKLDSCAKDPEAKEAVQCHDSNNVYEVTSGSVKISVIDDKGNLIMDKTVYIGSTNTVMVELP
ncbi:MAG: hypothetical protein PHX44_02205 [Sulfurimonas sp.]|uniref:hypothetical protein n=1 Tax=Sulfurimonas sp. TaxID=2022749 RepID=UPI0026317CCB|nr:hypothetical protein [Sulfurimonas sp.]MDD2651848.1 hypothetical protein [Sulfurimonas sp.]MDD3451835.1 hypothetical protein [Sulfurimonas sp.]